MKSSILFLICILICLTAYEQNMDELQVDKLKEQLGNARNDSSTALVLTQLAEAYRDRDTDSSFMFGQQALALSRQINFARGEAKALIVLSYYFYNRGSFSQGLELGLKSLNVCKKYNLSQELPYVTTRIGNIYMGLKDYKVALEYFQQTRKLSVNSTDNFIYAVSYWRIAAAYDNLNMNDSALVYAKKAEELAQRFGNNFIQLGVANVLGNVYSKIGNDDLALKYFRKSRSAFSFVSMANFFKNRNKVDSAIYYADMAYKSSINNSIKQVEFKSAKLLSELYEAKDARKALFFLKVAMNAQDTLYGAEQVLAANAVAFKEKERENEIFLAQLNFRNRVKVYTALAAFLVVVIIALLLFRNNRNEKKNNQLLSRQKNEIAKTLSELKTTQAQLIQSEKMASLGELTAGIAHEIQNPLNFVNNFSEVSAELADELKREVSEGDKEESIAIAEDIKQNLQKIVHHGKRADAIVKGMLLHSRASSGKKELTDINALADEYLRLSYHGLRAKDKNFNATIQSDYDETIMPVSIVPQDIGRVLLNLITNAFYSVTEKKKALNGEYEPTVTVATKKVNDQVQISVKDNGTGIPQKAVDKIFQPFFSTKPTGEGTGLGLSISYDIVKAHGGELKVESKEGVGSEFFIQLTTIK